MSKYLVGWGMVLMLLSGCAGSGPSSPSQSADGSLVHITDMRSGTEPTKAALAQVGDDMAVLHATKDGRVALQLRGKRQLLDETARVKKGGSYFQLHADGKRLQALWWSHEDGKNVYSTVSTDGGESFGPVAMANDDHGVLPPFTLVNGSNGVAGLAYHDERVPNYQVYFNRSTDAGRTWPGPDQRQDVVPPGGRSSLAFEPQLVKTTTQWLLAWTDSVPNPKGGQTFRLLLRTSTDEGITWSEPKEVTSAPHQISSLTMKAVGNRAVIAADELNAGVFALVTQDGGANWQRIGEVVVGSSGVINSGIRLTLSTQGDRAHLAWTEERGEAKPTIQVASVDIVAGRWLGNAQRLDTKQIANTRSTLPTVLATRAGPVVAAWLDYRDIRPNVYLAVSYDQGVSWSAPQTISTPGMESLGWPQLVAWGEGAAIAYERYPTDKIMEGTLTVQTLKLGDNSSKLMAAYAKETGPDLAERQRKLEQRVQGLWKARVAGDYEAAYRYFDFAYQAATPLKAYLDNSGVISYLGYEQLKLTMAGNEASVDMKVRYEVKPIVLPQTGKPISVAPFDADVPTKWVWVGNDWYFVYAPQFDQPLLRY